MIKIQRVYDRFWIRESNLFPVLSDSENGRHIIEKSVEENAEENNLESSFECSVLLRREYHEVLQEIRSGHASINVIEKTLLNHVHNWFNVEVDGSSFFKPEFIEDLPVKFKMALFNEIFERSALTDQEKKI